MAEKLRRDGLGKDVVKDVLTVAEAAALLGTTIPRLRRLLARPDMARCSRLEAIETKRGTRTSTVVLVSETDALKAALSMGNSRSGFQEQEQERSFSFPKVGSRSEMRTFSETEVLALQTTLRRTEELLQSKDSELAAKEEIITLLKEKIEGLSRGALADSKAAFQDSKAAFQEREQERTVHVTEYPNDEKTATEIVPKDLKPKDLEPFAEQGQAGPISTKVSWPIPKSKGALAKLKEWLVGK